MLLPALPIVFALLAVTAFAALGARRTHIPYSIFLVVVGLAISFLPGIPRIALRPDLVLSLLLPPLLYRAGVQMSWRGFRANLRPILLLAVGLVIFTTVAVAGSRITSRPAAGGRLCAGRHRLAAGRGGAHGHRPALCPAQPRPHHPGRRRAGERRHRPDPVQLRGGRGDEGRHFSLPPPTASSS